MKKRSHHSKLPIVKRDYFGVKRQGIMIGKTFKIFDKRMKKTGMDYYKAGLITKRDLKSMGYLPKGA